MASKYPFDDPRYLKFRDVEDSREFSKRTQELIQIWKKGKKSDPYRVDRKIPDTLILQAASGNRYRNKPHSKQRKRSNAFERLSPEEQREFKRDVAADMSLRKLLQKYPTMSTTKGVSDIIASLSGREKVKADLGVKERSVEKPIWEVVPGLTERLAELVRGGMLVKKDVDHVYAVLRKEFAGALREAGHTLYKKALEEKIPDVVWTPEVETLIKEVAQHHEPIEVFLERCSYIPLALAKRKWKELVGVSRKRTPAKFAAGIGRLASAMENVSTRRFRLPKNSFAKPFKISAPDKWSVGFLNGVNLGIPYGGLIEKNPARLGFADAEYNKDRALIITNLLDVDTKKAAGPAKAARAIASGRNVNIENFDARYARKVREMLRNHSAGDITYQTVEELFLDSMFGWRKNAVKPDKDDTPEFSGDVYVVLGRKEEDIIYAAAYWEARYWTMERQHKLKVKLDIVRKALAVAEKENDGEEASRLIEEIEELQDEYARTIVSNIHPEDFKLYIKQATAFVVEKLEEAIPNSRVIGIGTTYIQVGNEIIEIHIPSHQRVNDLLLANYTATHGPSVLDERMARTVVICHPYALQYRDTIREVDKDGARGSSLVCVAPITVDENFIREVSHDTVRSVHPIFDAINKEPFQAGMLRLQCINGVVNSVPVPVAALAAGSKPGKHTRRGESGIYGKYIWVMVMTDPHIGNSTREPFEIEDGVERGACEAVIEMLRRGKLCDGAKMPVHIVTMNDDPTQGHHIPKQQQPHTEKMSYPAIEEHLRTLMGEAIKNPDVEEVRRLMRKSQRFCRMQILRRGEFWTQDQALWFMDQLIESNLDFFDGVLTRGVEADLKIRGISDFKPRKEDVPHDSRDIGLINIGTGNHFLKSVMGEMTEGVIYARQLRALLRSRLRWRDQSELLERCVRAPLDGNIFIGYGTVQTPGGYEWGFDLRSTPPSKGTRWEDPLLNYVKIDMRRGNYSRIFNKRKTVKIVGDKHFFATVHTPYALYHMSAPDTPTDSFAEWAGAFPPNNTGVSFVGLPADGPESGPILVRMLRYEHIRDYFASENPKFDWAAFLPNPA